MNTHTPDIANRTPAARAAAGFTLAELLVALGVLLLLVLGINQVFTSVTRVVSVGSGVADVNAAARVIERQLREDLAAFSRIPADQNFMVIRGRKLGGDLDADGAITQGDGERVLYLTDDDRRLDLENNITPYDPRSRAVTVRLDEIVFMGQAPAGGSYESFQQFAAGSDGSTTRLEADAPVTAQAALISYGHGLRPYPDPNFDPALDPTSNNTAAVAVRQMVPDGDFGQRTDETNTFRATNDGPSDGGTILTGVYNRVSRLARNEFAGEFFVLRQAALLIGGQAMGLRTDDGANDIVPGPVLGSRNVIPFVRDWEIAPRLNATNIYNRDIGLRAQLGGPTEDDRTNPRLRRMGTSDIIAMTRDDVRRWLEGIAGPPLDLDFFAGDERIALQRAPRPDASPWSAGPFEVRNPSAAPSNDANRADLARNDPIITDVSTGLFGEPDDALWPQQGWPTIAQDQNNNGQIELFEVRPFNDTLDAAAPAGLRSIDRRTPFYDPNLPNGGDDRGLRAQIANTRGLTSAIAGTVTRMLAETEPPRFNRRQREAANGGNPPIVTETDAMMDLHAVLATRCSSLEIAWTNGWVWNGDTFNNLGEPAAFEINGVEYPARSARLELADGREIGIRPGERIWFDYEMSQLEFICAGVDAYGDEFLREFPMPDLIAEVPRGTRYLRVQDVTDFDLGHDFDLTTGGTTLASNIGLFTPDAPAPFRNNLMLRNLAPANRIESGVYDWKLGLGAENPDHEYLKVFPFRRPAASPRGGYEQTWNKPTLLRFRFTLHDERFRVEGGRQYEFIISTGSAD